MRLFTLALLLLTSSSALADDVVVRLRDGSTVRGELMAQRYPYFVDVEPGVPRNSRRAEPVRIPGTHIESVRVARQDAVAFPEEVEKPTLLVPMVLMLSSVAVVGAAFPLLWFDPELDGDDFDDGGVGRRGTAAFVLFGMASLTLLGALTTSLPRRLRRRRAWREMQRIQVGASASRRVGAMHMRLRF